MSLKRICIPLLIAGISSSFFSLYSQEDESKTKQIEKKWGMVENEQKLEVKKEVFIENPVPVFLTQFQPVKQEFPINPTMENVIKGKFGTKITLPANSISLPPGYRKGDILTIELVEVYNDLDFITSGVSLIYSDSKPSIFESGGMFKLTASYYDKPLYMKRGINAKVEIPGLIYSDKKMKMYKLDERVGWIDKGDFRGKESRQENTDNSGSKDEPSSEYRLNLIFRFLDDFKWWNCDYPNPDTTCIEGEVIPVEANPPYSITSIGIDYKNAATRYADNKKFQINAIKGKRVKLIAMDAKGNIGLSQELNTGSLDAFIQAGQKGKCTDVGKIQIQKISRELLKDRKKMLQHLGLVDIIEP